MADAKPAPALGTTFPLLVALGGLGLLSVTLVSVVGLIVLGLAGGRPNPKIVTVIAADDSTVNMAGREGVATANTAGSGDSEGGAAPVAAAGAQPGPARKIAQVESWLDAQVVAWNRGDLDGYLRGYWHSAGLSVYRDSRALEGWEAVRDDYRDRFRGPGKEMGKRTLTDVRVEVLGADRVLVRGRWRLALPREAVGGRFTWVVRRDAGDWHVAHEHVTADKE